MYPLKPEVYEEVLNLYHAREYVFDHYEQFGFYPYDVEINGILHSFPDYFKLIDS
tara:strand:+ start:1199 stop:1363 length:165 start_codon:yes stop_codon:yes gene_type:complete